MLRRPSRRRQSAQQGISSSSEAIVIMLGRLLWFPAKLAWKPIASRRWDRALARQMELRPSDKVSVYDANGILLGPGVRMDIDAVHTGFGIPFAWVRSASSVRAGPYHEIKNPLFYFGRSAWLIR